jgi:hypothetical protein
MLLSAPIVNPPNNPAKTRLQTASESPDSTTHGRSYTGGIHE